MPWVGSRRPRRILMRVDLPAPLAPIRPVTPVASATVRPARAGTPPGYTLVSAVASITALGRSAGGDGFMAEIIAEPEAGRVGLRGEFAAKSRRRSPSRATPPG